MNTFIEVQNSHFELRLDTISSFEWDELLIAGPYTNLSEIDGLNLNNFPSIATDYDQFLFFGFIHNKNGKKWISISNYSFLDSLTKSEKGYKIYPKNKTNFKIKIK